MNMLCHKCIRSQISEIHTDIDTFIGQVQTRWTLPSRGATWKGLRLYQTNVVVIIVIRKITSKVFLIHYLTNGYF